MELTICVAGKNNIATEVLQRLIDINNDRYSLCVICNEKRKEILGWQDSLRELAAKNAIPEYEMNMLYEIDNLVFLSMEYDLIVPPKKFKNARLYNIHFSYLPEYKGMYTSATPILCGAKYTGVTLHKIDRGIDTGDIIAQKKIPIESKDTARDLYEKYISEGVKLVIDNLEDIICGKEKFVSQSSINASYYPEGYINYKDLQLNINEVAEKVERQIRAFSFREYQLPKYNGSCIIDSKVTAIRSDARPGNVIFEDDSEMMVTTVDFNIVFFKDRLGELLEACECGNLDKVKEICVCKKHINESGDNGWTPLIVATYHGNKEIVKFLIANGADVFATNYNGTNMLMYAKEAYKRTGDRELFDLFIRFGISLDKVDKYGKSTRKYIIDEKLEELL